MFETPRNLSATSLPTTREDLARRERLAPPSGPGALCDTAHPRRFLAEAYDSLHPQHLASHLEIEEGKPSAWAAFLELDDPIAALQIAEADLQRSFSSPNASPINIRDDAIVAAASYLFLGLVGRAREVLQEARELIRERYADFALPFELSIAQWAIRMGFASGAYQALKQLPSIFEELAAQRPQELRSLVCDNFLEHLSKIEGQAKDAEHTEIASECRDQRLLIVESGYGAFSMQAAYERYLIAQSAAAKSPELAEQHLRIARSVLENSADDDNSIYAVVLMQHAYVLSVLGRSGEALIAARQIRRVANQLPLNAENQDTTSLRDNLIFNTIIVRAKVAEARGRHRHAHSLYERAEKLLVARCADASEFPSFYKSMADNAIAGGLLGAEEHALRRRKETADKAFGACADETLDATDDLISFLDRNDRLSEEVRETQRYLGDLAKGLGVGSFKYIDTLRSLSAAQRQLSPRELAESSLVEALRLARRYLKDDQRTIIIEILQDFAGLYERKGERDKELRLKEVALRYAKLTRGEQSLEFAQALLERAETYLDLDETALSERDARQALVILEEHPEQHADCADALKYIGLCCYENGDFPAAAFYLDDAQRELRRGNLHRTHRARIVATHLGSALLEAHEIIPDVVAMRRALGCFMRAIEIGEYLGCNDADGLDFTLYSLAHQTANELAYTDLANRLSVPLTRMTLELRPEGDDGDLGPGERVTID